MRLPLHNPVHRSRGSAVLVMIVLLSLMLMYVLANLKTLHFMGRELKLIEKRQLLHWSSAPAEPVHGARAATNAVPVTGPTPESPRPPEQ